MASLDGLQTTFSILATVGGAILGVDWWVHRREGKETELAGRIDRLDSDVRRHLEELERLRMVRAERIDAHLAAQGREIEALHDKASRFGTDQQVRVGLMSERLIKLEARVDEAFRALERRQEFRPREGDHRHD